MRRPVFTALIIWILFLCPMTVRAATEETEYGAVIDGEEFRLDEIEAYLERAEASGSVQTGGLSFSEIMRELTKGNLTFVFQQWADVCNEVLFSEIRAGRGMLGQILLLSVIGAVFSGLTGIFSSGHVSEVGFYVVYLLIMAFLTAGFSTGISIAGRVTAELLEFMQVLMPAYFLAAAASGSALTSASVCGFTFGTIGIMQTVLAEFLLPLTRIYMLLVLAGNLIKEDMISRCMELLANVILWTLKTMFGIVVGFHLIQGMIMPQADALQQASIMRLVQMIPGAGTIAGSVSKIILGSGVLIKNTIGMAGVIIMGMMAAVPVIKLLVLMCSYYLAAAIMQPVCDKRLVSCVVGTAAGYGLLLKIVMYSVALFAVTVAVLCIATNSVL